MAMGSRRWRRTISHALFPSGKIAAQRRPGGSDSIHPVYGSLLLDTARMLVVTRTLQESVLKARSVATLILSEKTTTTATGASSAPSMR